MTGAVSSLSAALSFPNENLYSMTLAADLHRLEETTSQSKDGGHYAGIHIHIHTHMHTLSHGCTFLEINNYDRGRMSSL